MGGEQGSVLLSSALYNLDFIFLKCTTFQFVFNYYYSWLDFLEGFCYSGSEKVVKLVTDHLLRQSINMPSQATFNWQLL